MVFERYIFPHEILKDVLSPSAPPVLPRIDDECIAYCVHNLGELRRVSPSLEAGQCVTASSVPRLLLEIFDIILLFGSDRIRRRAIEEGFCKELKNCDKIILAQQ